MRWFGTNYADERLVIEAESALAEDVVLNDIGGLGVTSNKGIVSLIGTVNSERERNHAEDAVRNALQRASLKHEQIVNNLAIR
ncbi:MAG: BON domain-containing protein [Caldilineaceae bacterium]|nr:BON domain-containing protein [Caldilineaceae bacterium]